MRSTPRESRARASPTACSSASVKSEKGGLAATASKAPRRHVHTRTIVTAADVQDRRRSRAAGDLVRSVSLSREIVRRQRLSGAGLSPRPGRHPARSRDRDRQAIRSGEGLRRPAQALGGRTHHRLSTAAADWPRTGRTSTATRSPSSSSRPFDSCSENSVILHKVSGRTLSFYQAKQGNNTTARGCSGVAGGHPRVRRAGSGERDCGSIRSCGRSA